MSTLVLERDFLSGRLHPQDLKNAVSIALNDIIKPVREYFQKNKKAKALYEFVREQEIKR